jgi:flagellar protein FliO/FliZ
MSMLSKIRRLIHSTAMSDPFSLSSLLRVSAALALLLGMLVLGLRALKRVRPTGSGDALKVVASLALSPRERLLLVQVGKQQLLIGSSPQGLRRLHLLPEAIDAVATQPDAFGAWLRRASAARAENQDPQ